ncbi:expressed unknown protein [Seminavis robusta]|uniref:Uncharacterized protein n=1 Tax=Seminavis robusta TaxID=568900 RepID=A0A9N8H8G1_9STRA|nr:expressed unknown protein [Seminavis robusta]|eukprot:Sro159_g071830.1 n/a (149) ;mRNA; r:57151-57597
MPVPIPNNANAKQVRVQYIEKVTTLKNPVDPDNAGYRIHSTQPCTWYQNENALVTMDNRCRITEWDQAGPQEEQDDFDEATAEITAELLSPFTNWAPPKLLEVLWLSPAGGSHINIDAISASVSYSLVLPMDNTTIQHNNMAGRGIGG